jgi:L-fuculose-phosphate aldolase
VSPNEYELRQEIVKVGRLMYEKGFICASDGNISARLGPGRLLITPSGLHKGFLATEQILIVDEDGQKVGGYSGIARHLKPTSELPMHLEAYRQRPDIQAVVHAHPPISIALSIAGIPMTDCLLPEVIVFLGIVPTTAYATPSSEENVRAIRELIGRHDALILQRHGSLTVGDSPMQGFMRLETVEQNARIGFMLAQLGVRNPLPPEEVRKLLRKRQLMGLSRAGEADLFCMTCGVCHEGADHAPTLQGGRPSLSADMPDLAEIRHMVSQVVQQAVNTNY